MQGQGPFKDVYFYGRNYDTLAALAVRRGEIPRSDIDAFVRERGVPSFAPTQGHLASAMCYLPHALPRLASGEAQRIMLLAKGSLFLGRMTELSEGMSVLLERNDGARADRAGGATPPWNTCFRPSKSRCYRQTYSSCSSGRPPAWPWGPSRD